MKKIKCTYTDNEIKLDGIVLDTKTYNIRLIQNNAESAELTRILIDEIVGYNIKTSVDSKTKETVISIVDINTNQEQELLRTKHGRITALSLYKTTHVGNDFLSTNRTLKFLYAPILQEIADSCFWSNNSLQEFSAPRLKKIGKQCFFWNESIKRLNIPSVQEIDDFCFFHNKTLQDVIAPHLKKIGNYCFSCNDAIERLCLPTLEFVGCCFMYANSRLTEFYADNLILMKPHCLNHNKYLKMFSASNLRTIGAGSFEHTIFIEQHNIKKLRYFGIKCFQNIPQLRLVLTETAKNNMFNDIRNGLVLDAVHTKIC